MTDHERSLRVLIAESVGGDGRPADCTIQGHAGTTVRDLIEQGAEQALWDRPHEPWVASASRSGRRAEADEPLAILDLSHGDLVRIEAADRTIAGELGGGPAGSHELAVIAGPGSGLRVVLRDRPVTVGRGEDADLTLADPSLSARHFRLDPGPHGWSVTDLSSSNGTAIDGVRLRADAPALLAGGAEVEAGRSVFALRDSVAPAPIDASSNGAGEIGVNRPPRMVPAPLDVKVEAPGVPTRPRGQRLPLVAALVPLLGGVVMWQLMHSTNYLIFTLLAPLMAIGTYAQDRMGGRGDFRKATEQLNLDKTDTIADVDARLTNERVTRRDRHPDAAEVVRRVVDTDRRLWERRPEHLDHLTLRIGLADLPSELQMTYGQRDGDKELRAELERDLPERRELVNVPAVVDLADVAVMGVVGPAAERAALTRWLTIQLAALHSPRDVELAALLAADDADDWEWLKWLPHVRESAVAHAGASPIATSTLQVSTLVDTVGAMQRERLDAQKTLSAKKVKVGADVVLLVEGAAVHDRAAMSEILSRAAATDVFVIWEAEDSRQLPDGCRVVIEVDEARSIARITDTATRSVTDEVTLDGLTLDLTEAVATSLAPLRDVTQADRGLGALPAIAHLADLERFSDPTAAKVLERWADPEGAATFTLGGGPQGPLRLDLVEHGPHALVGGTPGAGKSELLRGVLTSLALRYPPSRMTFLLVDFKGGAAFREFAALPHTVGIVTDLDEHLAERALTSFRAEIKYREGVLDEYGAIDVLDLARRGPHVVMPRLVIVIDEFATLAQEVPAFVDGVIDVTQRGRSLGVHLVLATQSPRGSVTGKIRANTNLAIGLRTVSADESNDILGTADAAAIPVQRKGRAWARIGDRDLVPFQSGYVGGSTFGHRELETRVAPFRIGPTAGVSRGGSAAGGAGAPIATTDLEVMVEAILEAFEQSGEPLPRVPWMPELPGQLHLGEERERAAFGLADEPELQRQVPLLFDLAEDGSMMVLGGPRAGKTTTLAMIAATLSDDHGVDELHVYGLDCGGRALSAIEGLPNTGSVVPGDDGERTTQLLAMLGRMIQRRRDLASETGASHFEQIRDRATEPVPRVLVLVDDYGGFTERYERVESGRMLDELRVLISDGPTFGVHFVVSADRRSAIPMSVGAAITRRLVHRMADRDEYSRAGLPMKLAEVDIVPGRAFTEDGIEVQVATWVEGTQETLQAAIARRGAELAGRAEASPARTTPAQVAMLPGLVQRGDGPAKVPAWHAFIGLRETELAPAVVNLIDGNFVIAGPYRSGRSSTIATVARGIAESTPDVELHLIAPRRTLAEHAAPWKNILRSDEPSEVVQYVESLLDLADADTPILLAIDDATEVDPRGISGLEQLLKQARDLPMRVLIGADAQALRTSYSPWHVQMRKDGQGMLLSPNLETDGDLLGVRLPWRRALTFPKGRGMLVEGGTHELVQVSHQPVG